jgi:hypothetical protein
LTGLHAAQGILNKAVQGTVPPLSAAQKAQASYALIMSQTKTAQGDFSRTSGGLANQQRILKAKLTDVSAEIGTKLLPIALKLATMLGSLVKFVERNRTAFMALAGAVVGVSVAFRVVQAAMALYHAQLAINHALTVLSQSTLGVWIGVKYLEASAWVRSTAAMAAHRIGMIASTVATKIATVATYAWGAAVRFASGPIGWIIAGIALLVGAIVWVATKTTWFQTAWKYSWNAIQAVVKWAWQNAILPVFKLLKWWFVDVLFGAAKKLLSGIKSAWSGIASAVMIVFRFLRDKIFYPIRDFFTKTIPGWGTTMKTRIVGAFSSATNGVKTAWDKLKNILKAPVKFFVDVVYNNGLRKAWNATVGKIPGVPNLPPMSVRWEKGGPVVGGVPGKDSVHGLLMPGEHVLTTAEVDAMGGQKAVFAFRRNLHHGGRMVADMRGQVAHAAKGGWIPDPIKTVAGKVGGVLSKGFSWATDFTKGIAAKALDTVFRPIRSLVNGIVNRFPGSGMMGTAVKAVANQGFDKMISFVKGKALDDIPGGKTAAAALKWARSQKGKPYIWGGVGPRGYDCSGLMSAIENVIRGGSPYSRRWATGAFSGGSTPNGWARGLRSGFEVGITHAGVGHTAGTLAGVNVESSGGAGVRVGAGARGSHNSMFPSWYGFRSLKYDQGGFLPPGDSLVTNQTGRWETVVPPDSSTPVQVTVIVQGNVISEKDFVQRVTPAIRDAILKSQGRNAGRFMEK